MKFTYVDPDRDLIQTIKETTMGRNDKRVRNWCYTVFNYTTEEILHLKNLRCKYHVFGEEICPTTQREHLQGYIVFKDGKTFRSCKKTLCGDKTYVTAANGDAAANKKYCSKGSNVFESGTMPQKRGAAGGLSTQERWAAARDIGKTGDFKRLCEEFPQIGIQHLNKFRAMQTLYAPEVKDLDKIENFWYQGAPGTGKSYAARRHPKIISGEWKCFVKPPTKWWDTYAGEELVVIDEIERSAVYMGHFLKIWGDPYACIVQSKGSSMKIRPLCIIITSNYTPEEIWGHDTMMIKAIHRRYKMKVFHGTPWTIMAKPKKNPEIIHEVIDIDDLVGDIQRVYMDDEDQEN